MVTEINEEIMLGGLLIYYFNIGRYSKLPFGVCVLSAQEQNILPV